MATLTFTEQSELAVKYINQTNRSVFLTGKAGSGKTTLLRYIRDNSFKNIAVAAPTGIAAINAGGVTLHSLLQLPFGTFLPDDSMAFSSHSDELIHSPKSFLAQFKMNKQKREMLRKLDLLVIDEVSMLRADMLDCADLILRTVRRSPLPFGGLQLLLIGDLNQLPPVIKSSEKPLLAPFYDSGFFFEAHALNGNPPVYIELEKIFRQTDEKFIGLLNRFRDNNSTQADVDLLNKHYQADVKDKALDGYIHITTHNRKADQLNQISLNEIDSKSKNYKAKITGDFPDHMYPVPDNIELKKGAQVMFIKNDPSGEAAYYNGKIGTIYELNDDHVVIETKGGDLISLEPYNWENKRYTLNKETKEVEEKLLGSFTQFPLKLAWAITVHKSQGLTFEKAILDISESFAAGQMYVALSRLTSLEGLILSKKIEKINFPAAKELEAFQQRKARVEELKQQFFTDHKDFLIFYCKRAFNLNDLYYSIKDHVQASFKKEGKSEKLKYRAWTIKQFDEIELLQKHAAAFHNELNKIQQQQNYLDHLKTRINAAYTYFSDKLEQHIEDFKEHLKSLHQQKRIKGYIAEVEEVANSIKSSLLSMHKCKIIVDAAQKGNQVTKETLENADFYQKAQGLSVKKVAEKKKPTAVISYELFRSGKSIEEIAEHRSMVPGTIAGHLSKFVAQGLLKPQDIIDEWKIDAIKEVIEKKGTALSDIKAALGEEFEYSDIKLVLAEKVST